jgi:hypothetical protein
MSLKKEFHKTLKQVGAEMRDWDETDNTQLAQFGNKHFGKQGCFLKNTNKILIR